MEEFKLDERTELEVLRQELDSRNYACGAALNAIWNIICKAKYGEWEYPMQAARLILETFQERKAQTEQSK